MVARVTVLGSTGSIGQSTLDVLARHPDKYAVHALSAYSRIEVLVAQARATSASVVVVPTDAAAQEFRRLWGAGAPLPELRVGSQALADTAGDDQSQIVRLLHRLRGKGKIGRHLSAPYSGGRGAAAVAGSPRPIGVLDELVYGAVELDARDRFVNPTDAANHAPDTL